MNLRVTNKIKKGELVLPTIGYAVKSGALLTLDKEKFRKPDIRFAIIKGLIEVLPGQEEDNDDNQIKIRNITKRLIIVNGITLSANEVVAISKDELESTVVQTAKSSGLISIEIPKNNLEDQRKENKTILKKQEVKKKGRPAKNSKKNKPEVEVDEENKDEDPVARKYIQSEKAKEEAINKANMQAWDAQGGKMLTKSEADNRVVKRVSTDEKDAVQVGDINFEKKASNSLKMKTGDSGTKPTKGLKSVGTVRPTPNINDEPSFVDKEQVSERMVKLGRTPPKDPNDIGDVLQEQETERTKIFRKQRRNNSEVE